MKETADRLKTVKTNHEIPESLEDVDFSEVKEEFTEMTDLALKLKEKPVDDLPDQLRTLDFNQLHQDFDSMKTQAEILAEVPKRDRVKEMNFTDVTAGYDVIKGAKNTIQDLPADADLNNVSGVDFSGLKTEFERMKDVSD
jgi:putative lipase involved disintegration of autophagic bodies